MTRYRKTKCRQPLKMHHEILNLESPAHLPMRKVCSPPVSSGSIPSPPRYLSCICENTQTLGENEETSVQNSKQLLWGETPWQPRAHIYLQHRKMLRFGWRDLKPLMSTLVSNVLSAAFSGEECSSQTSRQREGRSQEARKCDSDGCEL